MRCRASAAEVRLIDTGKRPRQSKTDIRILFASYRAATVCSRTTSRSKGEPIALTMWLMSFGMGGSLES
jgi:hypothetical protein